MATLVSLPAIAGWEEVTFDPVAPRWLDRMEGRRTESLMHGTAWWRATYRSGWLDHRDFGRMDAFMMRAGDAGEVFRAHDAFRPRPMAHDTGQPLSGTKALGGAFDGTANLVSIANARSIVVDGLPEGFQLRAGDYVELRMSTFLVSLHRIVTDATASAGGQVTLSIRYGLDLQHFTDVATVNFEKPSCLMQIEPGSWEGAKSLRSRRPSFSATEVFPDVA